MAAFSINSIPRSSEGGAPPPPPSSVSKKAPAPAGWVSKLQSALLAKANQIKITIDLGKTGPNKDGVDGLYGNKTREAVKAVARQLGIANPLDNSGRPSAEFSAAIGLEAPPAAKTPPATTAKPGTSTPSEEATPPRKRLVDVLNQLTLTDGTVFLMIPFARGLPRGGLTDEDEPWDAAGALIQMQYALQAGGIKLSAEMPKSVSSITTAGQYDEYMSKVNAVVKEIQDKCRLVADSFLVAVNSRRSEVGLPPANKPAPHESKEEVYDFEKAYWEGALAGISVATSAQRILRDKLLEFVRGSKKTVLSLLKGAVDMNQLFGNPAIDENVAKQIGKVFSETNTELARQIDPENTGYYFSFNKDLPEMRARLGTVMAIVTVQRQVREIINAASAGG